MFTTSKDEITAFIEVWELLWFLLDERIEKYISIIFKKAFDLKCRESSKKQPYTIIPFNETDYLLSSSTPLLSSWRH